jgi:hypothetical protein
MTRRIVLPLAVLLALAAALTGALLTPAPGQLPGIALGSTLVWRVEVAALIFVAAYGAIVTTRLALHGHTYTRVGSAGIEIPQIQRETSDVVERTARLETSLDELGALVRTLNQRFTALETCTRSAVEAQPEET